MFVREKYGVKSHREIQQKKGNECTHNVYYVNGLKTLFKRKMDRPDFSACLKKYKKLNWQIVLQVGTLVNQRNNRIRYRVSGSEPCETSIQNVIIASIEIKQEPKFPKNEQN